MTHFLNLPDYICVTGEARHFTFYVLIDTEEYECMHDILLPKAMCSESRDVFTFLEVSDNISEIVQDRHIVAAED